MRSVTDAVEVAGTVAAIAGLVEAAESQLNQRGSVGLAIPGNVSRQTGLIKNANSTWLNGNPFLRDLQTAMARPVRLAWVGRGAGRRSRRAARARPAARAGCARPGSRHGGRERK